jgi:hypothetical protein
MAQLELLVQPLNGARACFRTARGYQTWTPDNLCVESDHNGITYYTPRWDALCPYIDVTEDMLEHASKPFLVYALPPESPFGVPINEKYGLVDTLSKEFWSDPRRTRKFAELDKLHRKFIHSETVVAGRNLRVDHLFMMGREHFARYCIDDREVAGFVDYVRKRDVLVLQVHSDSGEPVLTDVSILLPERGQVYGSFCQWNRAYKNRSPGLYACLLASRWTAHNGYRFYNLGPVGSYDYKSLFVTDFEPVYGLALTEPWHPLVLDPTSPLHLDFAPAQWNQIYRTPERQLRVANSRLR